MKQQLNILAVVSTLDFANFTRRATLESLRRQVNKLDILFYTGIKNFLKQKKGIPTIHSRSYHFWIPDILKKYNGLSPLEHNMRKIKWKNVFKSYDVIFFNDPNQAWLLPYTNENQKKVYLIRDPNILQNPAIKPFEKQLLEKADVILATSYNLANEYIPKYYSIHLSNIHYWPNSVDLNIWDINKVNTNKPFNPTIGIAGNFGKKRTDYNLLEYITSHRPEYQFEIAGKVDWKYFPEFWKKLIQRKNVHYHGFIPLDKLPHSVANWNVGLITDKVTEYTTYMHHNKVYQYLSLGLPVVSLAINDDYKSLYPYIQIANSYKSYVELMDYAIKKSYEQAFRRECINKAKDNSSENRAEHFLSLLEKS